MWIRCFYRCECGREFAMDRDAREDGREHATCAGCLRTADRIEEEPPRKIRTPKYAHGVQLGAS